MPFVKKNNELLLYLTWSWKPTLSKSSVGSDGVYADESTAAGLGKQWSLKCTWSNMSELVWFSYEVLGGRKSIFFTQSSEKAFLFKQNWFYRAPSKAVLRARPKAFLRFPQCLALFPPNKAGPRYKSVKDCMVWHLAKGWIIHHISGGWNVPFFLLDISLNN